MKKYLLLFLWLCCSSVWAIDDFVWTSPSDDSSGSMPVGGGDIGMNVWVDKFDNATHCLFGQSGWFDENNTLLKAGRLLIRPKNQYEPLVEQRLCVEKGSMLIRYENTYIEIWVDVWKPVIHIIASGPIQVEYENWRNIDRPVTRNVNQQTSWKWISPTGCYTRKDSIMQHVDGSITFWHQNENETIFDYTVKQQQLTAYKDSLYNPLKERIFGGKVVRCNDQQWYIVLCNQQSSLTAWQNKVKLTEESINTQLDQKATQLWWHEFWDRSFIRTEGRAKEAVRNYTLFRYMFGCNAHPALEGERWPTKINGGLFTFNPIDCGSVLKDYDMEHPGIVTPDYRRWGGGVQTAQNQRLLYWPMLQTGDWDALQCQLDFYSRIISTGEIRSHHYWNHGGTCFTEQMENYGLPNPAEYGRKNPDPGVENNRWLEYEWDTQLEFADMYCNMPLDYSPLGKKKAAQSARRMIMASLQFFDEHYKEKDAKGHKIFYPGSACESYKITRNASSTIAGLTRLTLDALKNSKALGLTNEDIAWLKRFKGELPPIPTYQQKGTTCVAPAEEWVRIQNIETPQLYAVWPWRMVSQQIGYNTYWNDSIAIKHRSYVGWKQDNIWAAMIGDSQEAWNLTMKKLCVDEVTENSGKYRFPAFWGPGFDWMPDFNWGGSAMIGLHAMLMQESDDGSIQILPAWPKDEDVHFRLWASGHRMVEVLYQEGKIVEYTINGKKQKTE